LWNYEVLNLLATGVRRGTLSEAQADAGLELLNALEVRMEDLTSDALRKRIHRFARQFKLTACDAAYLELADRWQAPLLTRDGDLSAAARQRGVSVTLAT
jgi:predicted nucleic acid-binding protein